MKIIAMIPARYRSSRFDGKLIKDLGGKPVIVRTYESVLQTGLFDEVYVVTDSNIILYEIEKIGGNAVKSRKEHSCGSDRIAEVAENLNADIIVNVQGDEPFIDTSSLQKLVEVFKSDTEKKIDLASLKVEITDEKEIENRHNVKVITDQNDFAIYFSRNIIPYCRDKEVAVKYYKHVGVYAFRKEALISFYNTPMTPLESAEKIEAIRYLEVGKKMKIIETSIESIGIDTIEDLEEARKFFKN